MDTGTGPAVKANSHWDIVTPSALFVALAHQATPSQHQPWRRDSWAAMLSGSLTTVHRNGVITRWSTGRWKTCPVSSDIRILEIGSRNGTLLFTLHEAGYTPRYLSGLYYSSDTIKVACMDSRTRNSKEAGFHFCDFLLELPHPASRVGGTFAG